MTVGGTRLISAGILSCIKLQGCEVMPSNTFRFDVDQGGTLEYDEFLQMYRFFQVHVVVALLSSAASHFHFGGCCQQEQRERPSVDYRRHAFGCFQEQQARATLSGIDIAGALSLKSINKAGRVTWCCGRSGPRVHPSRCGLMFIN